MIAKRPKVEPPKVVPPTLYEACERLAALVSEREWWDDMFVYTEQRADLTALLAAVGWAISVEQASETLPPQDEAMF